MQLLDAACANAARREIDYAQKAGVVTRVIKQAQVGQGVFDFGALEKAQAAVYAVGYGGVKELAFNHAALCVAAVEDGDFFAFGSIVDELLDFFCQPLRFSHVAG